MEEDLPTPVPGVLHKCRTFYDDKGDLGIVSSYGVVFRVHAYHFQAPS